MGYIIAFILATIFLVGLIQWAQGGADLWRIFRLKRREKFLSREEVIEAENEVKKLEQSADRTIGASFRIIAVLAVIVWVMLGITMILDLLGINWVSSLSTRAKTYWSQPGMESQQNTQSRSDMLRNMGNNLRR
ncbi:MAG: hypothetical protein IJM82_02295 [Synergistaceae bacterium]|nr:hypothetical protein [Synergistaceae bacterium]MBQ7067978.1 hypothetical protein [Synergistaceae bacterium]MBR0075290.1 hypothetical protein [Synergistaceae bacterium]MBR0232672.1 hypothetical protein [Synergistaceae bacterium]